MHEDYNNTILKSIEASKSFECNSLWNQESVWQGNKNLPNNHIKNYTHGNMQN